MVIRDLITIRDMVRYAISAFNEGNVFYGHGTDNAWDEAVYLVFQTLHLPPEGDDRLLDARLTSQEKKQILQRIQARVKKRLPAPYLTHQAYFAGLKFYVDDRVLIPRSPIAELIERRFSPWVKNPDNILNILDLCTGSGCIAIACAHAFPDAEVDAVDNSKQALTVAKQNVNDHQLSERVHLITSDLFKALPRKSYDIIVSNPPYVSMQEWKQLPKEYHREPKSALVAGDEGLSIVNQILQHASRYLSEEGILVVEVGNSEDIVRSRYPEKPFVWLEFERGGGGVFLLSKDQL